ncbi:MAG: ribonuclease J [Bacilli bacterium]|nr:ribonuclease J [Bacilli bacterium]
MAEKIKIFALGGLDEDGKNCTVIDINGDLFVINCGVKFPDRTMPGIDYVIPNFTFLKENKTHIKGYFLLHGHDDEMGALAYLYEDAPAPIYASKVTATMFSIFAKHVGMNNVRFDYRLVTPTSDFKVAGRNIHFFHTAHNVADSSGIAIETEYGNIVITSDFVVENNATPGYLHDMNAIAAIAERPTLVLLSESQYANRPGYTAPNYKLTHHIEEIFKGAQGRIFISLFSMNLYNIDEVIRLAVKTRKKLICYDEATLSIVKAMESCGQLVIPKENSASIDDFLRIKESDLVVLISGFGDRLYSKIALLATNSQEDRRIKLGPTDTFIFASPSTDNNEIEATDAIDELYRSGCNVVPIGKKVFCNMHASEEDLKMMISVLKPKYYVPVKGFFKDLLRNGQVALSMGINLTHQNVFLLDNGMSLIIDEKGARVFDEKIPHGDIMIDGIGVGDVGDKALEDRSKLAEGVVVLAMTISKKERRVIAGPDVQMRGFVFVKEADMILRDVSKVFLSTVEEFLAKPIYNSDEVKQNVYEKCLRAIRRTTGKEPMVLPLIIEVE